MSMTAAQARVVDPVLTTHARGYRHPEHVGMVLFPPVDVALRAGKAIEFGKESFRLYNTRRAPGTAVKRVTFGYEGKPYALVQDSVDVPVPREVLEEAEKGPGVDLGLRATSTAMKIMALPLEVDQAALARNAGAYDANHKLALSGTSQWSDTDDSDPIANIDAAKEAVRSTTGLYPNVMVIGAAAWPALKNHPKIVERVKYTSRDSVTAEIVGNVLDLEKLAIGGAVTADDAGTFSDVWGKDAILAYAPQQPSEMEEPSFGYTYRLKNHPFVSPAWWDNGTRSWIYGATYERIPVLTGITAGFLLQNVSA